MGHSCPSIQLIYTHLHKTHKALQIGGVGEVGENIFVGDSPIEYYLQPN